MPKVLYEKRGEVAHVTLNRPEKRNAIDRETHDLLRRCWEDFRDDPKLRVAILTGAGDDAFCAGADLATHVPRWTSGGPGLGRDVLGDGFAGGITRGLHKITKPIVAALNGWVIGGGLELALACDIRVASERARFGSFHIRRGMHCADGGIVRLVNICGTGIALEMELTGEPIDAQRALSVNLVSRVVPHERLMQATEELVAKILRNPRRGVESAKETILEVSGRPLDDALRLEALLGYSIMGDPEISARAAVPRAGRRRVREAQADLNGGWPRGPVRETSAGTMTAQTLLTDDQRSILELAERFARERLAPRYQARDRGETTLERALVREMGALGLLAPDAPAAYGGLGLDAFTAGLIVEAAGYGDFNVAYVPVLASLMAQIIAAHARPELADRWIRGIVAGEALVAVALTEPRGGSDAAHLVLQATRCDGGYRLRGEKNSISLADQSDALVLFARTGPAGSGARGVSAFLVPTKTEGVVTTRFDDVGGRVVGRGSVFFEDVFVPEDHRLGEEGGGFRQVMQGFDFSRALLGLQCVGAAQASLDESWRYVTEREAFGRPLSEFQGVTFPLAEGETRIAAARELCYRTLRLRDAGLPHTAEAAMCKWLGPKTAVDVIHDCLLTHGHYGYSTDLPHQQRLRDVMGIEIGDGTAQIMKLIIARERTARAAGQRR